MGWLTSVSCADSGEFRLTRVVERRAARSKSISPEMEAVTDTADLINDEGIELVVIAAPRAAHYGLARTAIGAGKHVVVEKRRVKSER